MNQSEAAGIFVERARQVHRARVAVQAKRFDVRMRFSPLGERPFDAALVGDIEVRGETADVMQSEKSARASAAYQRSVRPRRLVFVRAVEKDHFGRRRDFFGRDRGLRSTNSAGRLANSQSGARNPATLISHMAGSRSKPKNHVRFIRRAPAENQSR